MRMNERMDNERWTKTRELGGSEGWSEEGRGDNIGGLVPMSTSEEGLYTNRMLM
jgi:hypothetical protein